MGKLLTDVEEAGAKYHFLEARLEQARQELREKMHLAHNEGISMNKIAIAAGLTREGVRYALGQKVASYGDRSYTDSP